MKILISMLIIYAGFAASFVLNGYLSKHLDLDGLGDFNVALSVASIAAALIIFGGQAAARRFIPQYNSSKKWGLAKGFIKHYLNMALMLGSAAILLFMLAAGILKYFDLKHLMHESLMAIFIAPLIAVSVFFGAIAQSMHRTVAAIFPNEVLKPLLFWLGCIIWLQFFTTFNEYEAIGLLFVSSCIMLSVQFYFLRKTLSFPLFATIPIYDKPQWHKVSVPLLCSALADSFLIRMDILTLEILHTNEREVGVYALLLFIASLVWMNFSSVSNVISPKIAELDGDDAGLQKLFNNSFGFLIGANILVAGIIIIFSDQILSFFHGDMLDYKSWLYVVLAGAVINCAIEVASPFLRFGGHQDKSAKVASYILMSNLLVTPLSILLYGMKGAIIALVLMRLARGLSYIYCVRKYVGIKPLIIC